MFNHFILMGIVNNIKNNILELEVVKPYKNDKQQYDVNNFNIVMHESIREYVKDYITIGNRVGVKGILDFDENNNLILLATGINGLNTFKLENE